MTNTLETPPNKGLQTTLIGIVVSAVLALIKGVSGVVGNSYALIADAIESGADVFTSSMLWIGLKFSAKPADENHPYGHGKAEALIAIGISLALVGAAGIIIKDSILHILEPHESPAPFTLIVLVVVTIALIGGENYAVADDYAAMLAGAFIMYNAYGIARPAIGELLDESLEPDLSAIIQKVSKEVRGVDLVEKCYIRKMGPGYQVDLHLWIDGNKSVSEGNQISHEVKDRIILEIPRVLDVQIHIEPCAPKADFVCNR